MRYFLDSFVMNFASCDLLLRSSHRGNSQTVDPSQNHERSLKPITDFDIIEIGMKRSEMLRTM